MKSYVSAGMAVAVIMAGVALSLSVVSSGGGSRSGGTGYNFGQSPAPWQCIGGCGAGGAGSGSEGIRWIGEEAAGGMLKVEVLPKVNFGRNFLTVMSAPRLTFTPRYTTEFVVSMPIGTKEMEVQYQTNLQPELIRNGGRGDLALDILQRFGNEGQFIGKLGVTFPTGEWDVSRGTDFTKNILPQRLQMGRGVYTGTLGLFYSFDVEDGMWVFDGLVDYPFNVRFDKKNRYLDSDYTAYRRVTENRERFYYRHIVKSYGESDRGDYYPPSLQLDAIYAYRRIPGLVQSFQFLFWVPFGVRWIHSPNPTSYYPVPDPDHRSWDVVLSYGMEFSRLRFPLFLGVGLPLHDRSDPFGRWDGPDWKEFGQEWLFAFGLKAVIF
ncbi:MAG: hypothetical protein JW863_02405 [Chitinispirillaceae bacterium]|nr:hypothetical protein [Chitinispirillaceae bacterium]